METYNYAQLTANENQVQFAALNIMYLEAVLCVGSSFEGQRQNILSKKKTGDPTSLLPMLYAIKNDLGLVKKGQFLPVYFKW